MNYYISDMHFFHKNVTKEGNNFDNRPFNSLAEMHEYMKEKQERFYSELLVKEGFHCQKLWLKKLILIILLSIWVNI